MKVSQVSVIIPTYNCVKYLTEAVESVLNQTYKDYEIIIVDDGSTDNTKQVLDEYLKGKGFQIIRIDERDTRYARRDLSAEVSTKVDTIIKYIYQANKGHAIARNIAINNASGEYIAILDADDLWLPERLDREIELFKRYPHIGLVHANVGYISESGKLIGVPKRKASYLSGYIFMNIFLRKAHISIPTILVRKICFEKVGLFDENLSRLGCEDRDMWLRISKEYRIIYIDEVLGYYRFRQGSMSKKVDKMMRARYYVMDKFCSKYKECRRLKRMALSKIHRELGDSLLLQHKFSESRKEYLKSLSLWPFSFFAWFNLIKALLGIKVKYVY